MIKRQNFISSTLTVLIVVGILILGDVSALSMTFTSDKKQIASGESVIFNLDINRDREDPMFNNFTFSLRGPEGTYCDFNVAGEATGPCRGIVIEKVGDESGLGYGYSKGNSYGYGYGYSYGYSYGYNYGYTFPTKLSFKITFDSGSYLAGKYFAKIVANVDGTILMKEQQITIKRSSCSVRAKSTDGTYNGEDYSKSKLNLFVTKGVAKSGQGYLVMQDGSNKRVTLNFKTTRIFEDNENFTKIMVNGTITVSRSKPVPITDTIVTINKDDKTVSVENSVLKLSSDLDIYFIKGC